MCRVYLEMGVSLFVFACIFVCIDTAIAACTTSKYQQGAGERLKCSNVTLTNAVEYGGPIIIDIMIFQSRIRNIPDRSFLKHAGNLIALNMHDCGIEEISGHAFYGLTYLKTLSLSYNNLTRVNDQWFVGLTSLQQLDLSHNLIASIEPAVFEKMPGLRRLDVRENRLTCLEPTQLAPMAGLEKLRFSGNPFTFRCRGKLTLRLKDLGISYKTEQHRGEENWLDGILWLCAVDDDKVAESEVLMKECVIFSLFDQLLTGLTTAESNPLSIPQECANARDELTRCVVADRKPQEVITNGYFVRNLLRQLKESVGNTTNV